MDASASVQALAVALLSYALYHLVHTFHWHPLAPFPGPRLAALTRFYRAYFDISWKHSFAHHLIELHNKYGDVVRIGPNELHFRTPAAYLEIFSPANRWDKEARLYHSFGEDRSSFGYLTYAEAKERKDILSRRFSRKAVQEAQGVVQGIVIELCRTLADNAAAPVDLYYAFRCMSVDVITYLCFAKSVDAVHAPNYESPLLVAMDASMTVFPVFKHFHFIKEMIMNCPPRLSKMLSPATAGLVDLQTLLKAQIASLTSDPSQLEKLPHSTTIYHELLRPEAYRTNTQPCPGSLYEEAQALMFGGADTTGMTLMHGCFYILQETSKDIYGKLKAELRNAWPDLDAAAPKWEDLERLPYLTGVVKESLRMAPGVASPLPRVVPSSGAVVGGVRVPGGTIVAHSSHFIHMDPAIFEAPHAFRPERWIGENAKALDRYLLAFSRGPRSCLGLQLAWAELYLTYAHIFRKFDVEIDESSPKELKWKDTFLASYLGPHLKAWMRPVTR
ncbi:cytochrome P450 [Aspergillus mulundensis]|uniref:Putative Cytochrome P450 n=1 Tax=Aspergillus mulundensis TaxID=1810919 RepID=A0A3D8RFA4_9EURO|nr:putative Cytochrome P450 [Aspergillus mulundensis]RDW72725.1 putative Cytochrome P450 [Aspergillus mulundensis]